MSVTTERPIKPSPFSLTADYNPVLKGALSLVLPSPAGEVTLTALPLQGETNATPLPEFYGVNATYPFGNRHET